MIGLNKISTKPSCMWVVNSDCVRGRGVVPIPAISSIVRAFRSGQIVCLSLFPHLTLLTLTVDIHTSKVSGKGLYHSPR